MPLRFVDVNVTENDRVLVQFSNGRFAKFTANDLSSLARFLETPDLVSGPEHQGITLCEKKLAILLTECIRASAKAESH